MTGSLRQPATYELMELALSASEEDISSIAKLKAAMGFMSNVEGITEKLAIALLERARKLSEGCLRWEVVEFGIGQLGYVEFKALVESWGWRWVEFELSGTPIIELHSPEYDAAQKPRLEEG